MRYALINPLDGSIAQVESGSQPLAAGRWRWIPIVQDPIPVDPNTEIETGPPTRQIFSDHVQETIQKRLLTAEEIDQIKTERIDRLDLIALQVAFNHENRIRALESKPAITLAQFKAAIKSLL